MSRDLETAIRLLKRVDDLIPLESLFWLVRSNLCRARTMEVMSLMVDIRSFLDKEVE